MTEENISKYIGRRIRYYRTLRGMTQKELGLKIGVKHNTVSSCKAGVVMFFNLRKVTGMSIISAFIAIVKLWIYVYLR